MIEQTSDTQKKVKALLGVVNEEDKLQAALHFGVSYETIKRYLGGTSWKEQFGKKLLEFFASRGYTNIDLPETAAA